MEKRRLLIADSSEDFQLALSEALQGEYHVHCCGDGKEALSLLHALKPELLVLDPMIPNLDGLSLLQAAAAADILPTVLAVTSFYNDYMLQIMTRLKVGYVMVKPCDIAAVISRIHDLARSLDAPLQNSQDPRKLAGEALVSLGFAIKHRGYTYLLDAVILYSRNPRQSITKELYPSIAALHNCLPCSVERSIRTAIESAWIHGDRAVWMRYFPSAPGAVLSRPSNHTFLTRICAGLRKKL